MKKLGLCLSGGGAKGAYQIGALKALEELGIYQNIKVIAGTSIGSANAALISSGDLENAKRVWFDLPKDPLGKRKDILDKIRTEKLNILREGLYSMEKFEEALLSELRYEKLKDKEIYAAISESGAANESILRLLETSYSHYIKKEKKVRYIKLSDLDKDTQIKVIKASCSIPGAFPPVVVEDKKYYDGGVFDNAPITPLIEAGCDEIIILNISSLNQSKKLIKNNKNLIIHDIKSKRNLGSILDFTTKHSETIYEYGYEDAMDYFKNLKQ